MRNIITGLLLLLMSTVGWGEGSTTTFFCEAKSRAQSKEDGEIFQFALSSKVQVEIQKDHALLSWAGVASNPKVTVNRYIVTSYLNEGQYFAVDAKMERDSTRLFTIKRDINSGDYLAALASASGGFGSVQSLDCTKF